MKLNDEHSDSRNNDDLNGDEWRHGSRAVQGCQFESRRLSTASDGSSGLLRTRQGQIYVPDTAPVTRPLNRCRRKQ